MSSEAYYSPNKSFLFGCDPEVFIKDDKGVVVPACGLIPGTKEEPFKVDGGTVQVDGVAAEIGIDPASNFEDFNSRVVLVMAQLKNMLPKGYGLVIEPVAKFDPEVFDNLDPVHTQLGCVPDLNAWTEEPNTPPDPMSFPYMRTGAGHLHIGFTSGESEDSKQHRINCRDLVRQLDWYLGSWAATKEGEQGAQRRLMYGQAGSYRIKPYGVEYRVLSNFWLTSKQNRLLVWNRMMQALSEMRRVYMPDRVAPEHNKMLADSLNSGIIEPSFLKQFSYPLRTLNSY